MIGRDWRKDVFWCFALVCTAFETGRAQAQSPILTSIFPSSTSATVSSPTAGVAVPAGFKLVGGGARTSVGGAGSLLWQSMPGGTGWNTWIASSKDHLVASPASIAAFAMGLSDPADQYEVIVRDQASAVLTRVSVRATLPAGYILTGGGCVANWRTTPGSAGMLLTGSFPDEADQASWICEAKEHGPASPASVTAYVIGLRPRTAAAPALRSRIIKSVSAPGPAPRAIISAQAGEWISGGGARALPTDPNGAGLLLTASWPEFLGPLGGVPNAQAWYAAAKDHAYASPGTVTAYAITLAPAAQLPTPVAPSVPPRPIPLAPAPTPAPAPIVQSRPILGEIRCFAFPNFVPTGWAPLNGDLLSINANTALFTLIGTTYGGDGMQTFALPRMSPPVAGMSCAIAVVGDFPSR